MPTRCIHYSSTISFRGRVFLHKGISIQFPDEICGIIQHNDRMIIIGTFDKVIQNMDKCNCVKMSYYFHSISVHSHSLINMVWKYLITTNIRRIELNLIVLWQKKSQESAWIGPYQIMIIDMSLLIIKAWG